MIDTKMYNTLIADRLTQAMKTLNITQVELLDRMQKSGYHITQPTLSKVLKGTNSSLYNIIQISKTLNIDMNSLFAEGHSTEVNLLSRPDEDLSSTRFIRRPDQPEMESYLGDYYVYFFPTVSSEDAILSGKLSFSRAPNGKYATANLRFETGKRTSNGQPICKVYEGELIISVPMSAVYCTLINKEIGEISYLLFNYKSISYEKLQCRIALALTSTAGLNRVPTVHRMLLSRSQISSDMLEILCGQLFLNNSKILISENNLNEFLSDKNLDPSVLEYFTGKDGLLSHSGLTPSSYYCFDEATVRNAPLDSQAKVTAINLLRKYSAAPKYNKVGNKCDDLVFNFLQHCWKPPLSAPTELDGTSKKVQ